MSAWETTRNYARTVNEKFGDMSRAAGAYAVAHGINAYDGYSEGGAVEAVNHVIDLSPTVATMVVAGTGVGAAGGYGLADVQAPGWLARTVRRAVGPAAAVATAFVGGYDDPQTSAIKAGIGYATAKVGVKVFDFTRARVRRGQGPSS